MGQEVGVGTQLMDVKAVLLAVSKTPADKGLEIRAHGQCHTEDVLFFFTLYVVRLCLNNTEPLTTT